MSEKLECPHLEYARVRKMYCEDCIAAAEERGRRRGVEERDELRDRMHQTIAFLLSCVASGEKLSDEEEAGIRAMLREGLAPRDSALNAKVGRSDDGLPVVNFDRDALHERAPRDSGKVAMVKEFTREEAVAMFGPRKDRP